MDKLKYFDTSKVKGKFQQVIAKETAEALESFCTQEPELEQAIEQSGKTFQECLDKITKGISASNPGISDIEIYRRAAKFYFSTAAVSFVMNIDLSGDNGAVNEKASEAPSNTLSVSLDEFLDF